MRIFILLICFCLLSVDTFGNAGVFRGQGQTPILEKTSEIQMVSEEIIMIPEKSKNKVDLTCNNFDKMYFHCRFILRNLTDQKVTLQVGFPLSAEHSITFSKTEKDTEKIIKHYNFSAESKGKNLPIRFVPHDKNNKFSELFLWEMTFEPKEELELLVSYTMEGYFGLAMSCINRDFSPEKFYKNEYLRDLCIGISQAQLYVTETGSSWAGEIEKAVFRYYPYEFENYLAERGAWVESSSERKARLARFQKKPTVIENLFSPQMPMFRAWNPNFNQWKFIEGETPEKSYLELTFQPYKPQKKDNIQIGYTFAMIPINAEQFEAFCNIVKVELERDARSKEHLKTKNPEIYEKYWKNRNIPIYGAEVRKNIADAILEFYGVARNNPEIADFLADQIWYSVVNAIEIDENYKQFLLKISAGE